MPTISRCGALRLIGIGSAVATVSGPAVATGKVFTTGMSFPLTGSLALQAGIARDAVLCAIDAADEAATLGGTIRDTQSVT